MMPMPFKMNTSSSASSSSSSSSSTARNNQSGVSGISGNASAQVTLSTGPLATASNELWNTMFKVFAAYQRQHSYDKFLQDSARLVETLGPLDACHFWLLKLEQANNITTRLEEASLGQIKARLRLVLHTQPSIPLSEYECNPGVDDIPLTTVIASFAALPAAHVVLHTWEKIDLLRGSLLAARLCVGRDCFPPKDMHLNPAQVLTNLHPTYAAPPLPLAAFNLPQNYYTPQPPPIHHYASAVKNPYHPPSRATVPVVPAAPAAPPSMSWRSDSGSEDDNASGDESLSGGDDDDEYTLVSSKKKQY